MGIMTASFSEDLAYSNPATSSHLTLGFSVTIACIKPSFNLLFSSSPSLTPDYFNLLFSFELSFELLFVLLLLLLLF